MQLCMGVAGLRRECRVGPGRSPIRQGGALIPFRVEVLRFASEMHRAGVARFRLKGEYPPGTETNLGDEVPRSAARAGAEGRSSPIPANRDVGTIGSTAMTDRANRREADDVTSS